MSKFAVEVKHIPVVTEYPIDANELSKIIREEHSGWRDIDLDDYYYFHTDWEGWRKIINYILPSMPKYIAERFDCDNYARWFSSEVARLFLLNTCATVEGWADMGNGIPLRHKWCVFYDGVHLFQFEPQNGVCMNMNDPLYVPDEIVIG